MAVYLPVATVLLAGGRPFHSGLLCSDRDSRRRCGAVCRNPLRAAPQPVRRESVGRSHPADRAWDDLLIAGQAERFRVSAAIGAFLCRDRRLQTDRRAVAPPAGAAARPVAAIFFFFFGLEVDPAALLPLISFAVALGLTKAVNKNAHRLLCGPPEGRRSPRTHPRHKPRGSRGVLDRYLRSGRGHGAAARSPVGSLCRFLTILGPILAPIGKG